MNKSFLLLLTKLLIIFVIVLSLGILSWAFLNYRRAQSILNPERVISFTAEGKVTAKPEVALLDVSVITQGEKASEVQSTNNKRMKEIINFLKQNGVDKQDIRTTIYSLTPQYDYSWCLKDKEDSFSHSCPPKIIGYNFKQTIEIKIRDFDKINNIVGNLTEKGANNISEIRFTIEDPEIYKNEARIEALNKIKQRAQILSQATGIKLGKIITIKEGGVPYYPLEKRFAIPEGLSGENVPQEAQIETGSLEITATMTVSYEIK